MSTYGYADSLRRRATQHRWSEAEVMALLNETQRVLDRWRYGASEDGQLWIQPVGPRLDAKELSGFLRLLRDLCGQDSPREIVFDFRDIDYIGPRWTVVLAMLIDFGASVRSQVFLTQAHGQPAAVVSLYRRNRHVRELTQNELPRSQIPCCA